MAINTNGIATESNCVDIGGQGTRSNKAVIKSRLGNFGCRLKDSPSQNYTDDQCVKYVDIVKSRPDEYVYSIYLSHVNTFLRWASEDTIFKFNENDLGGWDRDSDERVIDPSRYDDELNNSLNISCQIDEEICRIYCDKLNGDPYLMNSFYGLNYSFNLGTDLSRSVSWELVSNLGSESGSTLDIMTQIPDGSSYPESDGDPELSMVMEPKYFEKVISGATVHGSSVKLKLYIE